MRHDVFTIEKWLAEANKKKGKGAMKRAVKTPLVDVGDQAANHSMTVPKGNMSCAPSPLLLTLYGQLVSGKNQVKLSFKHGKVHKYPDKVFTNWRSKSLAQILEQVTVDMLREPIYISPVHLTVDYTPGDLRTRDVSGQLDALFHLLVYAKVLKDDGLVHDVTWRRREMNRKAPKVVLTIEEVHWNKHPRFRLCRQTEGVFPT